MELTLEQMNEARKAIGAAPLDKLPTGQVADQTTTTDTTENKEEKIVDKTLETTPKVESGITDEQLLELLKGRNINVSSLDELKPKAETKTPEQIQEEKEAARLSFALNKGLFNKKEYESFITDNSTKENLVFSQYVQEAKKEDPEVTDKELQTEFTEKYGLFAEPGTRKHKRGQREIELLADRILKNKYSKIYSAETVFTQYEIEQNAKAEKEKNILSKTPVYKKDIEDIFAGLKKITTKFSDTESVETEMMEESINRMKANFLKPEFIQSQIEAGFTKEQIKNQAYLSLVGENLPYLMQEHAKQELLKQQKGTKGIVPPTTAVAKAIQDRKLTKDQEVMFEEYQKSLPKAVAN